MRPRLTLFLLALVVLPLALLGWVGRLVWVQELQDWDAQWRTRLMQSLQAQEQALEAGVQTVSARFSGLLAVNPGTAAVLNELAEKEPFVRHAFGFDPAGKPITHSANGSAGLSSEDSQFLQRTAGAWGISPLSGQLPRAETATAGAQAQQGWQVWYSGDGPQFLFWQRLADGRSLGVEVERAAFLASLLNRLPSTTMPGVIRLVAPDGTVLWQSGEYEPPQGAVPQLTLPCAPPMHHWHWAFFTAPGMKSSPAMWPLLLGLGGAAALFAAISLLVFFTYCRHMRQAAQRVSFVNQVSHELKTPLTNIRLYADLARGSLPAGGDRYLDVVVEEAGRLSRLIHNVLTFARQDRQQLEVHPAGGDLGALIHRTIESWRPALQRKGITATVVSTLDQPALFDADATGQILGNLLSNVEKYALGASRVEITLGTAHGFAELRVADDGPGIPAKAARRIFEPFYRARSDLTEGVSGTGLGLGIARSLAEAQGGRLDFEALNKGACFVLLLPLADDP